MRGKHSRGYPPQKHARLIPAHAGKTQRRARRTRLGEAHPRACGENEYRERYEIPRTGSSPRMRGKPTGAQLETASQGLIPAHAGKTPRSFPCRTRTQAHPRACGENQDVCGHAGFCEGSSPRMRGKRGCAQGHESCRRLIPAHAGKTRKARNSHPRPGAHPRACGENQDTNALDLTGAGSSPRMRGKPDGDLRTVARLRLIPAHAGKTTQTRRGCLYQWAHPRACGENAERSGVLALRSVRSWKTFSFPSSLKVTHCRAFVQLPFSRIRL